MTMILLLLGTPVATHLEARQYSTAVLKGCLLTNIALNKTIEIPARKISQLHVGRFIVVNTTIKLNLTHDSYVICVPHQYILVTDNKTLITMITVIITNTTLKLRAPLNIDVMGIQTGGGIELGEPRKLNQTLYLLHDGEFTIEKTNNTLAKSLLRQGLLVELGGGRSDIYLVVYPTENSYYSIVNYQQSSTVKTGNPIPNSTAMPSEWTPTSSGRMRGGPGDEGASNIYAITLIASIATLLYYLTAVRKVESSEY